MGTAKFSMIVAVIVITLAFLPEQSKCYNRELKTYVPCTAYQHTAGDYRNIQRQREYRSPSITTTTDTRYRRWGR